MIVRLVKMTFRSEEAAPFQQLFNGWRHRIIATPGCRSLELLHDMKDHRVFFTRSEWDTEAALEGYRRSATFAQVWPVVKTMFAAPAEAWTMQVEHRMPANNDPNSFA
ncbi:MAG: antibiotic biosynthesis monooxygenase [Flavobacteriales bacterium]|nr:antibiotic biosynthesis monooxygenase [Flavobacteriales bacterium]